MKNKSPPVKNLFHTPKKSVMKRSPSSQSMGTPRSRGSTAPVSIDPIMLKIVSLNWVTIKLMELNTGRTIGSGSLHDGLYLLDDVCHFLNLGTSQALSGTSRNPSHEVIQWHRRLGHPSFSV
ncbi:uncharacterized protein LOC119369665 [Jatropha curcas]|uniref:uncharacterized protein LOC119369665 n=1 Tax=Jatropha curcas TaxID=180498 RepID=UPI0018945B03|nr:uncharacterized protein LOC119369665 [Jatropha curcas]